MSSPHLGWARYFSAPLLVCLACRVGVVQTHGSEPAATGGESDAAPAEQGVRAAFAAYVDALDSRDGTRAAGLVTPESIAHYDGLLAAALDMDAEQLRKRSAAEQLAVLTLRVRFTPRELAAMTGQGLFVESVKRGWVGRHVAKSTLAEVEVSSSVASIRLESPGKGPGAAIPAYRLVDGAWLFDLTAMLPHAELAIEATLERMTADASLTREAALVQLLGTIVEGEIDAAVWEPAREP